MVKTSRCSTKLLFMNGIDCANSVILSWSKATVNGFGSSILCLRTPFVSSSDDKFDVEVIMRSRRHILTMTMTRMVTTKTMTLFLIWCPAPSICQLTEPHCCSRSHVYSTLLGKNFLTDIFSIMFMHSSCLLYYIQSVYPARERWMYPEYFFSCAWQTCFSLIPTLSI